MEDDDYKTRHFTYYSRIVMIIVTGIELILFIVFIVIGHNIQSIMNKIYKNYRDILKTYNNIHIFNKTISNKFVSFSKNQNALVFYDK